MSITRLNHPQAKKLMNTDKRLVIIDVRTPEEYNESYIDGAINIPLDALTKDVEKMVPDKETPILVYCQSGKRSRQAAELLDEAGYDSIYDMGGLIDWPFELIM